LANDDHLYGVRGQTAIVYAPEIKKIWRESCHPHSTYIIPRFDGTVVLGGTFDMYNEYDSDKICFLICH
jgi:glycine/D-amino acid oxidase-like deaminating enzyme